MKIQIKFQKILYLVTLILAALSLVYGFAFCTGAISYAIAARTGMFSGNLRENPINSDGLYQFVMGKGEFDGEVWADAGMGFNDLIVILGVVLVVIVALQFFFATNSRRNYYITNYISVGVLAAFMLVVAIIGLWGVSHSEALFNAINWARYKEIYDGVKNGGMGWEKYSDSHLMFALGYVMYVVLLLNAIILVLNTVWKYFLMKGEKELLSKNLNTTEAEVVANEESI